MKIKKRLAAVGLIFSLIVLIFGGGRSPTTVYADAIEHTHIWADKYDSSNHWKYCTVCGVVKNKEAHKFTDHWYLGTESCAYQNYSLRTCSCGYSYTYHKPHQSGEYWNYSVPRGRHWKSCKVCGSWTENGECVDANKKRLTCKNPGTCVVCGRTRTSGYHFLVNGKCRDCGKIFFTYTKPKVSYNSDYSGCVVTFSITPVDSQAYLTGEYGDYTSGVYKSGTTSIKRLQDGTIEYTRTYTFNPLINSKVSSTVGNNESMVKINGYRTWTESFGISWTVWQDHQAPVQNDVIQKDQASANGWATIKQLTLSGTENLSDMVYLTVSDKATGEKYVTDAAVPVTGGKYSYTCTPSIEGDANGRTYIVAAKDRIGNTSTKEFVVSKTDGSAPQLKSGTSLTYTDWSTSKNISLSFFDFGSGGIQASLDNQTDYKVLTKSGEYYVWNHSFGNQVGTTEHTIYVRDALGNAGSYKLTVGNTDCNVYSITYNLNGGSLSGQKTSYTVADSFTLPQPTKTGYTFTGWTGSNGTTPQKTVTVNKGTRGNLSYTANWEINCFYLDLNSVVDGGSGGYGLPDGCTCDLYINGSLAAEGILDYYAQLPYGTEYEFKNFKIREGLELKGVYNGYNAIKGTITQQTNVNLLYETKVLTTTFHRNRDSSDTVTATQKYTYGVDGQTFSDNGFDYPGYKLAGYDLSKNAKKPTWSVNNGVAHYWIDKQYPANDVYAIWNINTYTNDISHWLRGFKNKEGNNGSGDAFYLANTYFSATYKSSFVMDSSRTTKIPNGCYVNPSESALFWKDGVHWSNAIYGTITQEAYNMHFQYGYRPYNYSITYNLNGGTNNSSNPSTYNVLYGVSLKAPTRAGYTFAGWYDENGNKITGINEGCNATFSSADDLYAKLAKRTTGNRTLTAHWSYNPVSVKVPQILTGDHAGKSQFRIKCDDLKAGNIKVTVPNSFLYKQAGKADVTAIITAKSGNNTITPTNKVCVYNITTKNGLTAGCWQGSFSIGLTLIKE